MRAHPLKLFGLSVALVVWVLIAGNNGQAGWAQGCTVTVQPGQSIQRTISPAVEGAVICLTAGTFQDNVTISRSLVLRGVGREQTIIQGHEKLNPVIRVVSDAEIEVTIEGLTAIEANTGIKVQGKVKVALTNLQISSNGIGLTVQDLATVYLSNSQVSANEGSGLEVEGIGAVEIRESRFLDNSECGIAIWSGKVRVRGTPNEMQGNGADLCGFAPAALRKPLVPQTNQTQLVVPGDYTSLQEAVDAIAPGGMITVAAGTYREGVSIWKPLTLRGANPSQTTLRPRPGRHVVGAITAEGQGVRLEDVTVTGSQGVGLLIYGQLSLHNSQVYDNGNGLRVEGSARVSLITSSVFGNFTGLRVKDSSTVNLINTQIFTHQGFGLLVSGAAQVNLIISSVSGNFRGLRVKDLGTVNLINTEISDNELEGLFAVGSAQVSLRNSLVSLNGANGLSVGDSAELSLINSQIFLNGSHGLSAGDSAKIEIRDSIISGNGTDSHCQQAKPLVFEICNGIEVLDKAQLLLTDSIIKDNAAWGVAAWLKPCGYDVDFFTGRVTFAGKSVIESNNRSGNQKGKGNPGNHPFKSLPDGQVCLLR
ncbi:right-handed parallel beta-helix repeat-containing protein [Candidatus Acetothermia bacterium]|nr:right-handed parallel beta-helix repeat-containing protein [Candidatus Acetothermia bacterium]